MTLLTARLEQLSWLLQNKWVTMQHLECKRHTSIFTHPALYIYMKLRRMLSRDIVDAAPMREHFLSPFTPFTALCFCYCILIFISVMITLRSAKWVLWSGNMTGPNEFFFGNLSCSSAWWEIFTHFPAENLTGKLKVKSLVFWPRLPAGSAITPA